MIRRIMKWFERKRMPAFTKEILLTKFEHYAPTVISFGKCIYPEHLNRALNQEDITRDTKEYIQDKICEVVKSTIEFSMTDDVLTGRIYMFKKETKC